ncbi:MAG: ATP F0F1 synthase subunit B, partial [Pseudomonadota bacterium]|nr:ATP F0F1 synthase subunit B [Pseudomonadota bacterium]
DYKKKFGKADADAAEIVEAAKEEAKRLTKKSNDDLKDLLARRQAAFDQRMNQLQVQAQNDVKSRAAELAIGALRKSLPEQLSANSLSALADSAIDDLPNRV